MGRGESTSIILKCSAMQQYGNCLILIHEVDITKHLPGHLRQIAI